jgi:hypothetical protein
MKERITKNVQPRSQQPSRLPDKRTEAVGLLGDKCQFEVADDFVDHGIVGQEGDDLHRGAALRTDRGVDFIDFADHLGPALGGAGPQLLLYDPEGESLQARLPDFSPVGVGIEAVISHRDLAFLFIQREMLQRE